ncbi:MAG TPA: RyR domain-containing protein [Xanthobacteraceae bacterium]|nr:RyR domain-containing protein [Xanthobacteraceae bacterium]
MITGDIVVDRHIYEGERRTPTAQHKSAVRDIREWGGAVVLEKLLTTALGTSGFGVRLGIKKGSMDDSSVACAYGYWTPFPKTKPAKGSKGGKQEKVWRTKLDMGYGHGVSPDDDDEPEFQKAVPEENLPEPDVLILDDAGFAFRLQGNASGWLLPPKGTSVPPWIILKMSQPVARGALWQQLIADHAERLICIVSAHELRAEWVNISRGLSWERTVAEVRNGLLRNPTLKPLSRCKHLIVRFSADGALWLDRTVDTQPRATLVYDAGGAEDMWSESREGIVFGWSATFAAAIGAKVARTLASASTDAQKKELRLVSAIKSGLAGVRELQEGGHGKYDDSGKKRPKGFPTADVAKVIAQPGAQFADARVAWLGPRQAAEPDEPWMIVATAQRLPEIKLAPSLLALARDVVIRGNVALSPYPHATFGQLIAIDRADIEALRSLRRLMTEYGAKAKADKPLSIGVFGPPGAGKSFGVEQISKELFGDDAWLSFNLSQFSDTQDLIGAFHKVRDKVLSGLTPVVFWDEFDTGSLKWLQYLLAPMQDGRFQAGQNSHWIGKCIFVFAGGTSSSYYEFKPPDDAPPGVKLDYRLKKGRDFHSRLDAYYDVVGPNQRALPARRYAPDADPMPDPDDIGYVLRRALLMRAKLGCAKDEELDFDSDLLDALLAVPNYVHGARSLEKVVVDLRPKDGGPIRRSALPAPALLAMHLDRNELESKLNRNEGLLDSQMVDALAAKIHHNYLESAAARPFTVEPNFRETYERLSESDKAPNRAAARRYPRLLALVGAEIVTASRNKTPADWRKQIADLLEAHLEELAEEEHKGWMEERIAGGWKYGATRDNEKKLHPFLVDYDDLPEEQKTKDRDAITKIPDVVESAGYRIVLSPATPQKRKAADPVVNRSRKQQRR